MSSAEKDTRTDVRLVPMRRQQAYDHGFADAWNAAPDDPTGVIRGTLPMAIFGENRGPCALAIMRALGAPLDPS